MTDPVAEAKAVWESMESPTARRVATALTQAGRKISSTTVATWEHAGWPTAQPPASTGGDAALAGEAAGADPPPLADMAGLGDAELLRQACREGLDAARRVFHLVKHDPALVKMAPRDVGALVHATGELIGKAVQGLRVGETASAGAEPAVRPRQSDPLAPALAAWEAALRETRP